MKLFLKISLSILLVIPEPFLFADPPNNAKWEPIPELSDEFSGTSLDFTKWVNFHSSGWKGREPSQYLESNVSLADGNLKLTSTVADATQTGNWVWAACVSSNKKICSFGYYEARIKSSLLSMTSSLWFQGRGYEIDLIENIGAPVINNEKENKAYLMRMNTHYFPNGWTTDKATPSDVPMKIKSGDDYQVYGVEWDSVYIKFYLNDVKVFEVKHDGLIKELMWMYFDTEVFKWDGMPTLESLNDPLKNTMYVDWVRAYRKINVQ